VFFPDPDLTIEVDLKREEEEKNGRRKSIKKAWYQSRHQSWGGFHKAI
jgi:hypothetical protein